MNDHINPLIAGILNKSCGVKRYRCWFNYYGLRLDVTVDCFPGEEMDKVRAILAAKNDVPGHKFIFMSAEEVEK